MINKTLHTKYGTARINKDGYYQITSWKDGNNGKRLHRLIWEDFYGCEVPDGYIIHHRNFNKLDNCILNLQLMKEKDHLSLHNSGENHPMYAKHHSEETKQKMSLSTNTTGYLNVTKIKCKDYKQGFTWRYQYYENGKRKSIESVDIEKLKAKITAKGLKWKKLKGGDE